MTIAFFGALMALSTFLAVILIADSFLTIRSTDSADRGNVGQSELRFCALARSHWELLSIAALISLAVGPLAARSVTSDVSPTATVPAAARPGAPDKTIAAAYDELRKFAGAGESSVAPLAMSLAPATSDGLPDVETMIRQLATRLEKSPNDAEGWRMLGWSYFNTDRYTEAAMAYDRAIALDPGNLGLAAARNEARRMAGDQGKGPTATDAAAAAGLSDQDRTTMVAGMVDSLAQRLAKSPHDEAGWVKLLRSRMVLGEAEAARNDLLTARRAFADEPEVLSRLTAAARAIGVPDR